MKMEGRIELGMVESVVRNEGGSMQWGEVGERSTREMKEWKGRI